MISVFEDVSSKWQSVQPGVSRPVHLLSWNNDSQQEQDDGEEDQADAPSNREASLCLSCHALSLGDKLAIDCCTNPLQIRVLETAVLPSFGCGNAPDSTPDSG